MGRIARVDATGRMPPPNWAVRQRALMDQMNRLARPFVERYTRPDGTLVWRREWPGMDGSDDAYESFVSFPLFYLLGGGDHVLDLARREWNALTWQFTRYGQVYREFDAYYDWMHHGESYTYLYYLALADPEFPMDRARTLSFASLYTGEDPEAPNWDAERKMIRSPITGSRGPRLQMSAEDWVTHRPILAEYLSPYEDVPGFESRDPFVRLNWNDDAIFARILDLMNARMVPGDVPLNLNATSLVTTAFLYTGEEKYRQWVLDYVAAWAERTRRNGGIMPDNIGPGGQIGERISGKWWGGYYGWRWPHGAWIILESTLIAGCNATLLTGDPAWFDLHRSQADLLWSLRRDEDGVTKVPFRHGDVGWFDFRPPVPDTYVRLYAVSQREDDRARLEERFPGWRAWRNEPRFFKAGAYPPLGWFAFVEGAHPDFPERTLDDTYIGICRRLERIEADTGDPETWDVHHWQDLNPVVPEGLVQMAMGTPGAVYHGGLLHASVRYFDPLRRRSGLPPGVAALVERVEPGAITLTLVNTDLQDAHDVIVQAGTFGEHVFTLAQWAGPAQAQRPPVPVDGPWLRVHLGPAAQAGLRLGIRRFARTPSAAFPPWDDERE